MKSNYLVAFGIAIMMISGFISNAALSVGGDKRSAGIDLYWISYQGFDEGCCFIKIMQIDQFGNIVRHPVAVKRTSSIGTATALAHGGFDKIRIWMVRGNGNILRGIIRKSTLSLITLKRTSAKTNPYVLQASQRKENNFLAIVSTGAQGDVLTALGLSQTGHLNGTRWNLSPDLVHEGPYQLSGCCGAGVSSDGRTAFWEFPLTGIPRNLFIQLLNSPGQPKLDAVLLDSVKSRISDPQKFVAITAADVTNTLPGGKKFVVYSIARFSERENFPDSLFLQVIDAKTAEPIGDKIGIRTFPRIRGGQTLAIDPWGRFVIFEEAHYFNDLWYQALDSGGHASGPMKVLANQVYEGIDILKE